MQTCTKHGVQVSYNKLYVTDSVFQLDIYISMDTEYLQYGLLVLQRFTQKCSDWNCLFPGCDVFDNYTHMSNKCLVDF